MYILYQPFSNFNSTSFCLIFSIQPERANFSVLTENCLLLFYLKQNKTYIRNVKTFTFTKIDLSSL